MAGLRWAGAELLTLVTVDGLHAAGQPPAARCRADLLAGDSARDIDPRFVHRSRPLSPTQLPVRPAVVTRLAACRSTRGRHLRVGGRRATSRPAAPRVYSLRIDTDDHAFITNGFVSHNTECRLTPLAMAMLQDIDEDTVNFTANYDGKTQEPDVLPSRVPNLLINGSSGIAVGMATNIPPHNLREVGAGVVWALEHPEAAEEELLAALMARIKGPDFPTAGLIVGRDGIEQAYRTGRGSVRMRAVVEVEDDAKGRTILVVTELPYQVNPDNLIESIAGLVRDGKLAGIAEINDESSDRIGMRIVVTLKRDAVAKVVLNNLYKHTQLQYGFGVNMLAIVDGVPRTLRLDQVVRNYIRHQIEVIVRRTRYRLRKAEERAHILRGYVKALDRLDEVIALIRASATVDVARTGLIQLLDVDEIQAQAILDMQLRRLAALERQKIIDELAEIELEIADLNDILARPERQRQIVRDELSEIVEKYGDDRRTVIVADDGRRHERGPHRRRRRRRDDNSDRLRQADEDRPVPRPEARREGRPGGAAAAGRHRRALLRLLDARLDPVLHEQGPRVPAEGLRTAGGEPQRPRPARGEPARAAAGRAHRPGDADQGLPGGAVPGARHAHGAREEVASRRTSTRTAPAA